MSDIKVYFLGEEYSVPEELKEFIDYLHYFEEIHNEIMPLLTNQIPKKDFTGGADADFEYFKVPLSKIGEKVIAKLADKSIFDVTLNDVVYNNKGYIKLHNVCKDTMQGMVEILRNAMLNWLDGYNNAYSSATSNITGSGVSIWTNSLSSALIYSALEASTLKKQADKADMQYRAAISSLNTNINDTQEKQKTELLVNKYYPGAAEALGLFVSEMMECYISKLEQHDVFDYSKVKKYDLQRSSDLLKNITLISDKVGLLKEAFICCPYNPDIYNAVLENGLADVQTFETAKCFMQDGILVDVIEKYAKDNVGNIDSIKVPVKVLALYKGQKESSIWKTLYSSEYLQFYKYYENLNKAIKDRSYLIAWIKDNITDDALTLCSMDKENISNKVKYILSNKVITDKQFSLFSELKMFDKEFCVSETDSLDAINAEYANTFIETISKFIPELQSNINKYSADVDLAKQKYESSKQAYDDKFKELQDKESDLKQQREMLGFFAFSKKKEMNIKILKCQEEIEALKKSDNTQELKTEYEHISNKLHSLDIGE